MKLSIMVYQPWVRVSKRVSENHWQMLVILADPFNSPFLLY